MGAAHNGPGSLILKAGLLAGLLDGFDAIAFAGWYRGVPVARIFQFIASGAIGAKAFQLGGVGVALGVFFHFTIAIGAAAVFYLLTRRWTWPLQAPLIAGPLFGIGVFLFMRYVVVALSAIPPQPPSKPIGLINLVFSHIFFVGIPIAVSISRATKSQLQELRRAA
jgi:hypothetical protein